MRKPVKEIENVLQNHGYSIDTIICDVMKTFKLKTICCRVGFQKQEGYSASEIITIMLMLPLMLLKSINSFYKSEFQKVTAMKKDTIYRLKNNEKMPWRALLLAVAKQFQRLVNPQREVTSNSAFILSIRPKPRQAGESNKFPWYTTMHQGSKAISWVLRY